MMKYIFGIYCHWLESQMNLEMNYGEQQFNVVLKKVMATIEQKTAINNINENNNIDNLRERPSPNSYIPVGFSPAVFGRGGSRTTSTVFDSDVRPIWSFL
ncbi:MAG: hypothetical protein ACYDH8_12725 [Syntrophales bacterium]